MWTFPKIISHRGGGTLAPENTLAAMKCGLQHGYHAVEFDTMLSEDGVPVLMHDPFFGRTVAGSGNVCETSVENLTAMDAGAWFSKEFAGERVPTLQAVADYCRENDIWMNIEIKPAPGFAAETGRVVGEFIRDYVAAHPGMRMPLFSSFQVDSLVAAKAAAPAVPRGFLNGTVSEDWLEKMATTGAIALHTNEKHLTREQAAAVKAAGFGLFCYTVNDPVRAKEILSWGVDAFCTDRIDLIGPDFS